MRVWAEHEGRYADRKHSNILNIILFKKTPFISISLLRVYWYELVFQFKDNNDTTRFMVILDNHGNTLRT